MSMCCLGALEMPSNYALMCEEEMTYVEGGETVVATLQDASDYFKRAMSVSSVGALASTVFAVTTFGAFSIGTAYFGCVVASAVSCYNKCQKWLDTYNGSKSLVNVTAITAGIFITGLEVSANKLVR